MAHSYNAETFRCGCELCADTPEARRKGEPGQDPRRWHLPVSAGRHHIVLSRLFSHSKVSDFVIRHHRNEGGWFVEKRIVRPDYDSDDEDPDARDAQILFRDSATDATGRKAYYRGVVLNLRDEYGDLIRYAGRAGTLFDVFAFGSQDDPGAEYYCHRYFEVEVLAKQSNRSGQKPVWDWSPYLGWPSRDAAIVTESVLLEGAKAYRREFYDWVRLNLVCLRKLVDQRRAAPPGYLLIKGEFVKPRRTSRATTSVDVGIVSKLCDRSTLPDVVFRNVVSYTGNLEPHRPWRKNRGVKWGSWDTLT